MGFGFGVPGFRISTRGVRVGPRIANVRVGRGGAGVSVGPRIARVSVGTGGVRVGSGVGPLYVSNRGAGVSVGGGLGGIGVSTRGLSGFVGPGPFWFGGGLRWPSLRGLSGASGRAGGGVRPGRGLHGGGASGVRYTMPLRHSVMTAGRIFSSNLPNLAAQHASLKVQLAAAGVKRRNKYEIRQAAAEALLWGCASAVSVLRAYHPVQPPEVPPLPTAIEIRREARRRLRERKTLRVFMKGRNALINAEIDEIAREVDEARRLLSAQVQRAHQRFLAMHPEVLSEVLDNLLADNQFPARWVGNIGGAGLAVVAFGGVDEMVWPEEMRVSKSGGVTVGKVGKEDLQRLHKSLLARAVVSTGIECLAAHPLLSSVRVVAVDGSSSDPLPMREVWGDCVVSRRDTARLASREDLIAEIIQIEQRFAGGGLVIEDEQEYQFFNHLISIRGRLDSASSAVTSVFGKSIMVNPAPKGGSIRTRGSLITVIADDPAMAAMLRSTSMASPPQPEDSANVLSLDFWRSLSGSS